MIKIAMTTAHIDDAHALKGTLFQPVEAQAIIITGNPVAILIRIELSPQRLEQVLVFLLHRLLPRIVIQRQPAIAESNLSRGL